MDDKTKALAQAQTDLEKAKQAKPDATPNPEVENKLKDLTAQLQEKDTIAKKLAENAKSAEAKAKMLEEAEALRQKNVMKPGLEGTVLAVNPSWNFIVLSMGDHQGVLPHSTLIIKRGGAMVAKVRVTSVEPVTSIADIVPGTLHRGDSVQPGDVVIFSGSGS